MILEHDLLIQAPRTLVWGVTLDVEHWPLWNPNVKSARWLERVPGNVGSRAEIRQPGMGAVVWTITEFEAGERFTWRGRASGLAMAATHVLSREGDATRNRLRLEISGWVAWLFAPFVRRAVATALERENEGLRARCETGETIS